MQTGSTKTTSRRVMNFVYLGIFIVLQLLVIAIAFMGGYIWQEIRYGPYEVVSAGASQPSPSLPSLFKPSADFPLLSEAYKLLNENGYKSLPDLSKLQYGMIRGMLQAYDEPFTVFVDPPEHVLQTNELEGRYGGIGVRLEYGTDNLAYLYPLPDSPALKAGIQDGDRLIAIEGKQITPETPFNEPEASLRGKIGQPVKITIGHAPDYAPVDLSVQREEVAIPSVTWNLAVNNPTVGVVQVHVIADPTPKEVTNAIQDLQKRGATHFILDLRGNGGGLVDSGVNTARLFLKSGEVIEQQYKGQDVKKFMVEKPGPFADLKMVVLVNKGTASSAEIITGAIKGQKRAPVVGKPTYGKDTIQLIFSLSDGSSLHVTAAHWWVPGLEPKIGGKGVQPDVVVPDDATDAQFVDQAVNTVLAIK